MKPWRALASYLFKCAVGIKIFFFLKVKLNARILKIFTFLPVVVGNYISKIIVTDIPLHHLGIFKSKNRVWKCSLLFSGSCPSGLFLKINNPMPTFIGNKHAEFSFAMLQLLKLIKTYHCQWYKSYFNHKLNFCISRRVVTGGQNIQLSLTVPYFYVMKRLSVLII